MEKLISVESISFNYDLFGNSTAIPLFGRGRPVIAPEWTPKKRKNPDPAAFVVGHKITMLVDFRLKFKTDDKQKKAGHREEIIIRAKAKNGKSFQIKPKRFNLNDVNLSDDDGYLSNQIFSFSDVINSTGIHKIKLVWKYKLAGTKKWIKIKKTKHKLFIVWDYPNAPMHFPNWVQVLEKVCSWAKRCKSGKNAAKRIAKKFKKEINFCAGGISRIVDSSILNEETNAIFLQGFLNLVDTEKPIHVECYDVAYILDAFFKAFGLDSSVVHINSPFKTKLIKQIGHKKEEYLRYNNHGLVEYENLWYDVYIDHINVKGKKIEPIEINRKTYFQTLLLNPDSTIIKALEIIKTRNYHIQYKIVSALNTNDDCGKVKDRKMEHSFVKNIEIELYDSFNFPEKKEEEKSFIEPKDRDSFHISETLKSSFDNFNDVNYFWGSHGNILYVKKKDSRKNYFIIYITKMADPNEFVVCLREESGNGVTRRKLIQTIRTTGSIFHRK